MRPTFVEHRFRFVAATDLEHRFAQSTQEVDHSEVRVAGQIANPTHVPAQVPQEGIDLAPLVEHRGEVFPAGHNVAGNTRRTRLARRRSLDEVQEELAEVLLTCRTIVDADRLHAKDPTHSTLRNPAMGPPSPQPARLRQMA